MGSWDDRIIPGELKVTSEGTYLLHVHLLEFENPYSSTVLSIARTSFWPSESGESYMGSYITYMIIHICKYIHIYHNYTYVYTVYLTHTQNPMNFLWTSSCSNISTSASSHVWSLKALRFGSMALGVHSHNHDGQRGGRLSPVMADIYIYINMNLIIDWCWMFETWNHRKTALSECFFIHCGPIVQKEWFVQRQRNLLTFWSSSPRSQLCAWAINLQHRGFALWPGSPLKHLE